MKFIIVLLCLIFMVLQVRLWSGQGSFADVVRLERQIEDQAAENGTLRQRNQALYAEVDDLKSGLDAIEERARSELGMIKQGETFYLIVEEDE